jgi:hypothetical protein
MSHTDGAGKFLSATAGLRRKLGMQLPLRKIPGCADNLEMLLMRKARIDSSEQGKQSS